MRLAEKVNLLTKDKFAKVINIIHPKSFFLDYITINWMIPIKTMSSNDFAKAKLFHKEIYQILKKRILVWQQNNPECNGMRVIIDSHYNIQIHFSGKFFMDSTEIKFDVVPFYKWFLEIDNMIKFYWSTLYKFETNNIPLASVSRLDIATQKKDTFLNGYTSFPGKDDIVQEFEIPFKNERYTSGITIGPKQGRATRNIFFRAYDKRFEESGYQHCLHRFKTIEVIRKEWLCRGTFLRSNNIRTPEDLILLSKNPKLLSLFIKKIRMSKDCFTPKDNNAYKSLHDLNARDTIRKSTYLTLKEFDAIYSMKYGIFLKKLNLQILKNFFIILLNKILVF